MRSRSARVLASLIVCLSLGAAAAYLVVTEHRLTAGRDQLRAFDLRAHDTTARLSDLRVAQQAYVADGQALAFWTAKVATLLPEASADVDALRRLASSRQAGEALLDVSAQLTELGNIDKRARDYVAAQERLMASDVVFTEGGESVADAAQQVEQARLTEHQAFDGLESTARRMEAYALGGAAGLSALLSILLAFAPAATRSADADADAAASEARTRPGETLSLRQAAAAAPSALAASRASASAAPDSPAQAHRPAASAPAPAATAPDTARALQSAAAICTGFGQVREVGDVRALLEQAAGALDANGLIVWLGDLTGGDLQAVVAHGYSDDVLARIKAVSRMADNAAAAAYRSSAIQIVPGTASSPLGAIVAPILVADGCIGALTAETRNGQESAAHVQALVSIFAAQLASVLAGTATADVAARAASA